eukprot:Lankesteria_metandrocarpae@DN7079_c0_g1_i1.p1
MAVRNRQSAQDPVNLAETPTSLGAETAELPLVFALTDTDLTPDNESESSEEGKHNTGGGNNRDDNDAMGIDDDTTFTEAKEFNEFPAGNYSTSHLHPSPQHQGLTETQMDGAISPGSSTSSTKRRRLLKDGSSAKQDVIQVSPNSTYAYEMAASAFNSDVASKDRRFNSRRNSGTTSNTGGSTRERAEAYSQDIKRYARGGIA